MCVMDWVEVDSAFINDGHYLCYCNDIVSSWFEVLTYWGGDWYEQNGNEFYQIVSHIMPLPKAP